MEELKIQSLDCPAIKDLFDNFDINSISKEERDAMYVSYTNDYMLSLHSDDSDDDVEDILKENKEFRLSENKNNDNNLTLLSVKETIEVIKNEIPSISQEQFRTISNNGIESLRIDSTVPIFWMQPIFAYLPDRFVNISIIDEKMAECGYIDVRKYTRTDEDGRDWWYVIYNPHPKFMRNIKDVLYRYCIFHYTPEYNRDSILETGLVPSRGGRTFMYPDNRVFFTVTDKKTPYNFVPEYIRMMKSISKNIKKNDKMFSGYFDLFELDITMVPKSYKVYWDPNNRNGIYLNEHINPEWLTFIKNKSREF